MIGSGQDTMKKNNSDYWIKDIKLASLGKLYTVEALKEMQGLTALERKYSKKKPLKNVRIVVSVVPGYEAANFVILLKKLGANVRFCTESMHYSVDEACAYMVSMGIPVFAKRHITAKEYFGTFLKATEFIDKNGNPALPEYIIDDGAEFTEYLLKHYPDKLVEVKALLENTTSGINVMYSQFINKEHFPFPIYDINSSVTKSKFDNIYGSRESLLEGLLRSVNIQIGGKRAVIFGYGEVGKGCAQAMRGLGAHISIVEIDPIMAMQSIMEGYELLSKQEAIKTGDIFISTTGCIKTIDVPDFLKMKDGAIMMNMSEHDQEINSNYFRINKRLNKTKINDFCDKYLLPNGKNIYLLCDGYIINLYAGNGHPPKVMGITYTNHTLALLDLVKNPGNYKEKRVYHLPRKLDEEAALLSFPEIKSKLNKLTAEQAEYMGINKNGPFKREDYYY